MTIDVIDWKKMLLYARNHDYTNKNGYIEWNIFANNNSDDTLILAPNVNKPVRGEILAEISVKQNEMAYNKLDLYWKPGWKLGMHSMEGFDNVVKWKADYTREWINSKFLD